MTQTVSERLEYASDVADENDLPQVAAIIDDARDLIDEQDDVIERGIDLLAGNLTGIEWKRATLAWVKEARAVRAKAKGERA